MQAELAEPEKKNTQAKFTDLEKLLEPMKEHGVSQRIGVRLSVALRHHVPIIPVDFWPYLQPRTALMWVYLTIVPVVH